MNKTHAPERPASDGRPVTLRRVTADDADCLFRWRSDERIYRFFRTPTTPAWDEHVDWLRARLADPGCFLFVIEHDGRPAGHIRIERRYGSTYEVSIYVDPDFHRCGIGGAALRLVRDRAPFATLSATVLPGNDASRRLFDAAGYVPEGGHMVNRPQRRGPTVAICPDGGPDVGLGHLTRCAGLAKEIAARGVPVALLVPADPIVQAMTPPAAEIVTLPEGADAADLHLLTAGAGALVVDHYRLDLAALAARIGADAPILHFDDHDRPVPGIAISVNGSPAAAGGDGPGASGPPHRLYGPRYQILRDDVRPRGSRRAERPERLLVTYGGADPLEMRPVLQRLVTDVVARRWPDLHVDFVVGRLAVPPAGPWPENATVHHGPDNMPELMAACDVAVTAGGQTMFELARCGAPMVVMILGEDQRPNVEAMERNGCILNAGWAAGPRWVDAVSDMLDTLLSEDSSRERLHRAARKLFDGNGAKRIADAILRAMDGRPPDACRATGFQTERNAC